VDRLLGELRVVDQQDAPGGRRHHRALDLDGVGRLVVAGAAGHRGGRHEEDVGAQRGAELGRLHAEERLVGRVVDAAEADEVDPGLARELVDERQEVRDHRQRRRGRQQPREAQRGGRLVEEHGLAALDEREGGAAELLLGLGHGEHPVANVAVEERRGLRRGAPADLAQPAPALEGVEVAVDRHRAHGEGLGELLDAHEALLHDPRPDPLLAVAGTCGARPLPRRHRGVQSRRPPRPRIVAEMREIAPGLHDWTTFHEGIGQAVHSHLHAPSGTLIDPRVPDEGLDAVAAIARPQRIVLTNRHHLRHSARFAEAFGCPVLCHEAGLREFSGSALTVEGFSAGDELADGVHALEVGAITPEEVALHLDAGPGFLALADILRREDDGGALGFFPGGLLGDDPEAVRRAMTAALARLLDEEDFDGVLLAHGEPFASGGRRAIEEFVRARAGA
jgi:hypothetical protein